MKKSPKSKALLVCGHWVKVYRQPFPKASMMCTSGLGCGYNLTWTLFVDENGKESQNEKVTCESD